MSRILLIAASGFWPGFWPNAALAAAKTKADARTVSPTLMAHHPPQAQEDTPRLLPTLRRNKGSGAAVNRESFIPVSCHFRCTVIFDAELLLIPPPKGPKGEGGLAKRDRVGGP